VKTAASFVFLILAGLATLGASGCDDLADQTESESAAPTVAIGTPAAAGPEGWTVTVTGVRSVASVKTHGGTRTPLGTYLAVEMIIENTSNGRQALGGNRFQLADDRGRNFTWYEAGTEGHGKKELGSRINPGLSAPVVVLFDVPADATGLVLRGIGGVRISIGDAADY
jgi:hypothetical protein